MCLYIYAYHSELWILIVRTDAKAPLFWTPDAKSQLIGTDPDAGKDWRQNEKGLSEESISNSVDMNLSKFQEIVEYRGSWHAAAHEVTKSWTQLSHWTTINYVYNLHTHTHTHTHPGIIHFKFYLFICWLHWVFIATCGLSLVVASEGHSSLWCVGSSLQWLLVAEHGL